MLVIHSYPPKLGLRIGEAGNPEIVGEDPQGRMMVIIEINSVDWKAFVSACNRLPGIGITPAGRAARLYVPGGGDGEVAG